MKKLFLFLLLFALFSLPLFAAGEEGAPEGSKGGVKYGVFAAAFAIAITGFAGALGQGKAISSACEGLARNPGAAGAIRTSLLLGLAFIESIVIYALLIAFLTYKL
ncbi:MAG: ATP synthase F0 subunit C [Thermoanaerobaculia bacterium]